MEKLKPRAPVMASIVLGLILLALYIPVVSMAIGSLGWYQEVFNDEMILEALWRSLVVGLGSATITTILGTCAALAIARTQFRFKAQLEIFSLVSLVIPELVFALSLLAWFFMLKLQLSLITVMIAHVTFSLSFVIFTVNARLASLDFSLDEAAFDLGASEAQVLWKVTLPLLKPALAASFLLSFLLSFDDFLITFFTSGVGSDTLPIKLYAALRMGSSGKLNALATLMILISAVALFGLMRFAKKLQARVS